MRKPLFFAVVFLITVVLHADGAKTYVKILDTVINLNSSETANLILYDGYSAYDSGNNTFLKGVVTIKGGKNNAVDYPFIDDTRDWPVADPEDWPVYTWTDAAVNTVVSDFTYLKGNNVLDLDGNGENEVYIYGESSHGSGYYGKVFSFEKRGNIITRKFPVFYGAGNFSIIYYRPARIVITACYLGPSGSDGDGDYEFFISELENGFKDRFHLGITKKPHTTEYGPGVIEENIGDILEKYRLYKKGRVEDKEKLKITELAEKYWQLLSENRFAEIKKYLAQEVSYYSAKIPAEGVIKDKKRIMDKNKGLKFGLSDFLIYTDCGLIYAEYDKNFHSGGPGTYGSVRSLLTLTGNRGSYLITGEKDIYNYDRNGAGK